MRKSTALSIPPSKYSLVRVFLTGSHIQPLLTFVSEVRRRTLVTPDILNQDESAKHASLVCWVEKILLLLIWDAKHLVSIQQKTDHFDLDIKPIRLNAVKPFLVFFTLQNKLESLFI